MLKFLVRCGYHNLIYTDEPELFYDLYKWIGGLFILILLRRIIGAIIFCIIGIVCIIFIKPRTYGLIPGDVGLILIVLEIREIRKQIKINKNGEKTPAQIRTSNLVSFIRRYVSINGNALGRKEWKKIKEHNNSLYNELLCNKCNHCCYYYSLEIAKIIRDSILIWGAIKDPFEEEEKYYAHAIILRNGYIYDSNMRQSVKYENFVKVFKLKIYKKWNDNEYVNEDFRVNERAEFRKWCEKNDVLVYERF